MQWFDDTFIRICQKPQGRIMSLIGVSITGFVAIEIGIAAPFILFALGQDAVATELAYLMLLLAVFSQVPKRFMWRYRPYMVKRAKQVRMKESAVTSSFPSRAVTCATVYSFLFIYAYNETLETRWTLLWWQPLLIIGMILLSSFARVHMGVHYPSDCLGGFLQGIVVCVIGTLIWDVDTLGCASCYSKDCYSFKDFCIDKSHLKRINFIAFSLISFVGLCVAFFSVVKPIDFWTKCDRVYGMLFPPIAFHITFLCPHLSDYSLAAPSKPQWYVYFYAFGIAGIASIIAHKNSARYPVLSYLVQFFFLYTALCICRIWMY